MLRRSDSSTRISQSVLDLEAELNKDDDRSSSARDSAAYSTIPTLDHDDSTETTSFFPRLSRRSHLNQQEHDDEDQHNLNWRVAESRNNMKAWVHHLLWPSGNHLENSSGQHRKPSISTSSSKVSPEGSLQGGGPGSGSFLRHKRGSQYRLTTLYGTSDDKVRKFVLTEDNIYYQTFLRVIVMASIYNCFMVPFEFAFLQGNLPHWFTWTDTAVNLIFVLDIILRFNLAYADKETRRIVTSHASIAKRYLTQGFILDLLATVPWTAIYTATKGHMWIKYMALFQLYRIKKVEDLFTRMEKDIHLNYFFTRITRLMSIWFFSAHLAACIMYFLATTVPAKDDGYTFLGSLTLGNFSYSGFRDINLGLRYTTVLYFIFVTMATVGYGDIHPVNPREMIAAMILITINMLLSAYLLGNITALVMKGNKIELYRDKMSKLIQFMDFNSIRNHKLRQAMKEHVKLEYDLGRSEDSILDSMPQSVRGEMMQELYAKTVYSSYLFKNCSPAFINNLVEHMQPEFFLPNEIIIYQKDTADHFFILHSGILEEYRQDENGQKEEAFMVKGAGQALGEVAVLCNIPQPLSVRAKQVCCLLRLNKDDLHNVLQVYSIDGRRIVENVLQDHMSFSDVKHNDIIQEIRAMMSHQEAELVTTVMNVCARGDIRHLKKAVDAGADVNKGDYDKRRPLHVAAGRGYAEIVAYLIGQGAKIHVKDNFGNTPLLEALRNNHSHVIDILIEAGAKIALEDAGTELNNAIIHGNVEYLQRLLDHGVSPNVGDYDLRTPLHVASAEGFFLVAKILVEHGANPHAQDRWGNQPSDDARRSGSAPLVLLLQEAMLKTSPESTRLPEEGGSTSAPIAEEPAPGEKTGSAKPSRTSSIVSYEGGDNRLDDSMLAEILAGAQKESTNSMKLGSGLAVNSPLVRMMANKGGRVSRGGGQTRKRVTLYDYNPLEPPEKKYRIGKVVWLPLSVEDTLHMAEEIFKQEFNTLLNADGGEITSLDLVLTGDRIFLTSMEGRNS